MSPFGTNRHCIHLTQSAGTHAGSLCAGGGAKSLTITGMDDLHNVVDETGLPLAALLAANPNLTHPKTLTSQPLHVPCGKMRRTAMKRHNLLSPPTHAPLQWQPAT